MFVFLKIEMSLGQTSDFSSDISENSVRVLTNLQFLQNLEV